MENLVSEYFEYMDHKAVFFDNVKAKLAGKTGKLKDGPYKGREFTILSDWIDVDYWGIYVHIGIHRRDGKPGYLDAHNESYVRLSNLEIT